MATACNGGRNGTQRRAHTVPSRVAGISAAASESQTEASVASARVAPLAIAKRR